MTSMERARKLIDDCRDDADPYNGPDGEAIAAAIDAAVAEERAFWEGLLNQATGVMAEVLHADDLTIDQLRKKARHHYDRIAQAVRLWDEP